ncbi:hypothetical protein MTO96_007712 [Rhipicephalus appendiculatus]
MVRESIKLKLKPPTQSLTTLSRQAGGITRLCGEEFSVRNMDGFLGKCLLMAYAAAIVALIVAPNEAEAIPPMMMTNILRAMGRTEENDKN